MKEEYLMKKIKTNEKGFTLIEVIVTLILVGITSVLAGMWIVSVANGYIFAKTNAGTTQKAQLAMTRLVKEFSAITAITVATANSIEYNRTDNTLGVTPSYVVSQNGTDLLLAGYKLTDSVYAFSLSYCPSTTGTDPCGATTNTCSATWTPATSRIIRIDLVLTAGNNTGTTFTQCITPRNL